MSNEKAPSGSLTPRTYPTDTTTVRCDQCERVGRYRRETLLDRFGPDMAMPDVLNTITEDCARNAPMSADRCKAVYGELAREF
ncbi:MAG: hypothetical protein O7F75_07395 [Alphaproteobacteria bacterium]|nr:hypothetical protein [Alphaproteobacteria bacterium]